MCICRRVVRLAVVFLMCAAGATAQSAPPEAKGNPNAQLAPLQIQLVVPAGTPLRVALTDRVRIQHPGDPVKAVLASPIYAFDQEVIPAGSEVRGKIIRIDAISKKKRVLGIANADFTPARGYGLAFDSLVLPDGKQIAIETEVSPGAPDVVRLVSDPQKAKRRNRVTQAAADTKAKISSAAHATLDNIKSPGRTTRLKHYLEAQLPVRRQYLEAGTRFNAVLEGPLDFGTVSRTRESLAELGTAPADDSMLEARLAAEVSSATAKEGAPVEAVVTAPLFSPDQKLVFPANSKLVGEVLRVKAAGKLHHNGQLRVVFRRIELPDGVARSILAGLEGMEVDRSASLKLDAEGGAQATDSKTRYLSTGVAVAVAALASRREGAEPGDAPEANRGTSTAAGGSGFRLVGAAVSFAIRSTAFSTALGAYGAASSIYTHFLSRGRDVDLPANTPIEIGVGNPHPTPPKPR